MTVDDQCLLLNDDWHYLMENLFTQCGIHQVMGKMYEAHLILFI